MTHANAPFTELGRLEFAQLAVDEGWPIQRVADRFQCAYGTVQRWACRYRTGEPMTDRSSRPHSSPNRIPTRLERRIIALRFTRRWGPHRIGYHLGIARSTVGRVLARFKLPRLRDLDQATGLPARKPRPVRFKMSRPGELVHVDMPSAVSAATAGPACRDTNDPTIARSSRPPRGRSLPVASTTMPSVPSLRSSSCASR